MNINLKFLLLGTSLSLIPNLTYAQCAVTDCLQLGYTSLKSCDNGLKCPFGEYWACPKVEEKAVLGQCTGYAKNCKIGDILNSDGTCTTDKVSGKTPLGVVIAIKDGCGWAMTTKPILETVHWTTDWNENKTGLPIYSTIQAALQDFDARGNMTKIEQVADNITDYIPANAALTYAPSAAPTTKGLWMLPTAGMLNSLYKNRGIINVTISKLGETPISTDVHNHDHIWSSSATNYCLAWLSCWGNMPQYSKETGITYSVEAGGYCSQDGGVVHPVIEF